MLYCSLCETDIFKYSKHCRVCDKCVDRFDHHCRWLNNCIGKKNYRWFVALVISVTSMLVLQSTVGLWVVVHCFLDQRRFQSNIVSKLGSSFSVIPYVVVVSLCTCLAMVAIFPLGQLLCFHVLLIKKGISTYDYVVAMREQGNQLNAADDNHSPISSPTSYGTTAERGPSFARVLQQGSWCRPPHLLVDQQTVVQSDVAFTSREYEPAMKQLIEKKSRRKPPVKLSTWTLAHLNTKDALCATAQARKNSSNLQPIVRKGLTVPETNIVSDRSGTG
eukprot:c47396_g1_i1 orf=1-828(+)